MTRKSKEFIHEGKYAAEVSVELIEDDTSWSPYLPPEEVHSSIPFDLPCGAATSPKPQNGRVFELTPVAAK